MNPPFLFIVLTKWFWAVCVAGSFIQAAIFQTRARQHIRANPDLRQGYRTLITGFVTWGNLPWVVMGIGCVFGDVPSVFSYFRPRDGNPFVLSFLASVVLVWVLGTYWIVFRDGAGMLVKYPGLLNMNLKSRRAVMIYWFLSLAGGLVAIVIMFSRDIPLPPFRP
jgi:hypothetical protein